MEEKHVKAGETVIKEKDDGDVLYVVEVGQFDCFKIIDGENKFLKTYEPGEAFGELALLYNAPRAATIVSKTDGSLIELDRNTFNNIVKEASIRKREKYEDFLSSVPILSSMDTYERAKVADAIKELNASKGEEIIKEGEDGNLFFLIIEGEAEATKEGKLLMSYKSGDYFGELALLKNAPRAATVTAKTNVKLATIDRSSFSRLLGPLDRILKRNMENY